MRILCLKIWFHLIYTVTVSEIEGGGNDVTIIKTKSIRAARQAYAETVARAKRVCEIVECYTLRDITDFSGLYRIELEKQEINKESEIENFDTINQSADAFRIKEPNLIF